MPKTQQPRAARRGVRHVVSLANRHVITRGIKRETLHDLYHYCMTASWPQIFVSLAAVFLFFNLLFAALYAQVPQSIANENPVGYWGDFFFSAETLSTVGYGDMHPQNLYGHVIAVVEIFIGTMSLALVTGVMFARFSRPRARFLFSRYAVVRPIEGKTTLMLRAANARQNVVLDASAQVRVLRDRVTSEGFQIRRVEDLKLIRNQHPIFLLGWNIMHVIDESSPLYGETPETLTQARSILLLTMSGTDESTGQVLMARYEYGSDTIRFNHAFHDILSTGPDGLEYMDYTKFHDTHPLAAETLEGT